MSPVLRRAEAADMSLAGLIESCVEDGIITADQGAAVLVRASERTVGVSRPAAHDPRVATEALGYLGGVVVAVSTILIANLYWGELPTSARVAVLGGAAVSMLVGGLAVPQRLGGPGVRLRSVLWLAATAACAGFFALVGDEALDLAGSDTAVLTAVATTAVAATLWWRHPHLTQQVATFSAAMTAAATVTADQTASDSAPGFAAWVVAAGWFAAGWSGRLSSARAASCLAGAAAVVATLMTVPSIPGLGLAVATLVAMVALAVVRADLALLAVSAAGTVLVLPAVVNEWFDGAAAAPYALLVVGLVLVALSLWTARRASARHLRDYHEEPAPWPRERAPRSGNPGRPASLVPSVRATARRRSREHG